MQTEGRPGVQRPTGVSDAVQGVFGVRGVVSDGKSLRGVEGEEVGETSSFDGVDRPSIFLAFCKSNLTYTMSVNIDLRVAFSRSIRTMVPGPPSLLFMKFPACKSLCV